jgi:hypothetical protein
MPPKKQADELYLRYLLLYGSHDVAVEAARLCVNTVKLALFQVQQYEAQAVYWEAVLAALNDLNPQQTA